VASPVQRRISTFPVAYNGLQAEPARGMASMFETQQEWEGQVIDGKFPLLQHLGGSDHSAVFLTEFNAKDGKPGKAALKLVSADSPTASRQLARWSSAAVLSHRHLQRIFQTGRCQLGERNLLYLVMECAEENLSQVLPQRPLSADEARDMLQPVVDALVYLHGRNLVHGQMKPESIMVVAEKLKISSDHIALAGEANGDNGVYTPPEIAQTGVSPAADVWSLGVTLLESLTQAVPAWNGIEGEDPKLPAQLPPPFDEIASKCLRYDPERRCSVAEIAAALRPAAVDARPNVAAPPAKKSAEEAPKTSPLNWRYGALAAAALAVTIAVAPRLFQSRPRHTPATQVGTQPADKPIVKPSPIPDRVERSPRISNAQSSHLASTSTARAESRDTGAAGGVLRRVLPDVPQSARDTIQGIVRVGVKVQVDATGNVTDAELVSPGPSKYFARLARQAAQDWKFAPAQSSGQNVPAEWTLRFAFGRDATEVSPERTSP